MTEVERSIFQDQRDELDAEWAAVHDEWQAKREQFEAFIEPFKAEIEALAERADDIRNRAQGLHDEVSGHAKAHLDELDKYEPPEADLPEEPDGQLYDSRRDYEEQLVVYKRHKNGGAMAAGAD